MLHPKDTTIAPKSTQTHSKKAPRRLVGLRLDAKEYAEVQEMARQDERSMASFVLLCMRLGIQQMQNDAEA